MKVSVVKRRRLYFGRKATQQFIKIISPYIIPAMRYKLPWPRNDWSRKGEIASVLRAIISLVPRCISGWWHSLFIFQLKWNGGAPFNGVTCATLISCYKCHERLPSYRRRKVRMTSNQHGPLMSWATHMLQWPVQRVAKPQGGANPKKSASVQIAGCNSPAWSWNR